MTEAELQAILSRNPQVKAAGYEDNILRQVRSSEPKPRASDALDSMVARERESQRRIIVRFMVCRAKLLDIDAVAGCCKDLLDGLQDACLIPGDRQDQISFEASQKKVGKKDEGVIIDIEYA